MQGNDGGRENQEAVEKAGTDESMHGTGSGSGHHEHGHSHESSSGHHEHSHVHRKHHRHHKKSREETPAEIRKKKQLHAVLFTAAAAVLVILFWLALKNAEGMLIKKKLEGSLPETEEEMTEIPMYRQVQGKVKLNGTTYTYDHIIESWLFIGTDGSGNEQGTGEDYHGTMADFLVLAVFDKTDQTYALLQLDRNTVTDVKMMQPDGTAYASADMPLCTAHWYGGNPEQGCENTVDAVSRLLGKVEIDGYYCLGMEDIGTLNHAVGGVEVTIEDDFSESDPTLKMGETVLLNDEQAVSYVRGRMTVADGSNTNRMKRQRQYMEAYLAKVKERTKEHSSFINDLYHQLLNLAVTTMTGRDLSRLAKRVDQGENLGIFTIEGESAREYSEEEGVYHARFYPDKSSIEEVMKELYHLKPQEKKTKK